MEEKIDSTQQVIIAAALSQIIVEALFMILKIPRKIRIIQIVVVVIITMMVEFIFIIMKETIFLNLVMEDVMAFNILVVLVLVVVLQFISFMAQS